VVPSGLYTLPSEVFTGGRLLRSPFPHPRDNFFHFHKPFFFFLFFFFFFREVLAQ
jgi:hypothetical protein